MGLNSRNRIVALTEVDGSAAGVTTTFSKNKLISCRKDSLV
jgi:hypothetical protein